MSLTPPLRLANLAIMHGFQGSLDFVQHAFLKQGGGVCFAGDKATAEGRGLWGGGWGVGGGGRGVRGAGGEGGGWLWVFVCVLTVFSCLRLLVYQHHADAGKMTLLCDV